MRVIFLAIFLALFVGIVVEFRKGKDEDDK